MWGRVGGKHCGGGEEDGFFLICLPVGTGPSGPFEMGEMEPALAGRFFPTGTTWEALGSLISPNALLLHPPQGWGIP